MKKSYAFSLLSLSRMDGSIVQIGCTVFENPINSYIISEDHLNAVYLHGKAVNFI